MATYRQLPEVFRRLHPRFKTPWLALVLFAGVAPIAILLPGDVNFVGTLYAFGATFSFTVAHASIVRLRMKPAREEETLGRARPNLRLRGVEWPLFAIVGGTATAISFVVILLQNEATRWTGIGWIALGLVGYVVYRRRWVKASPRETVKAPAAFGPALALQYRRLLVPVLAGRASDEALDIAAGLSAERGAQIAAVTVLEIPLDQPLSTSLPAEEAIANTELDEARAVGDSYGVSVIPRLLRGRSAGAAIVEEAERRGTEIIVIGARRQDRSQGKRAVFGSTVDYVLKNAPCRVMVTATEVGA
jgi:APA family basic amino acid/polyamine antiporter